MVFCDMGVNPTPWGFSAYDEVTAKLTRRGIPRDQVATIGDADSDAKKKALFDKVRSGQIRVLIGSTSKMGTGTNVQKRLVALHHLDNLDAKLASFTQLINDCPNVDSNWTQYHANLGRKLYKGAGGEAQGASED